ncbi:hypothetical protein [[Phormidium] sp. ETS-05]|uniref:hypothetical protein n=1 Tax=[Phormidium] sp. ETS-05 TaxID=222819 RepID=UPI001E2874DF|nr:hypothetical protein [[Phormidium] sp. ETS-05]
MSRDDKINNIRSYAIILLLHLQHFVKRSGTIKAPLPTAGVGLGVRALYQIDGQTAIIKRKAENRTTRYWDVSSQNCPLEINSKNKRRQAGGYYLKTE